MSAVLFVSNGHGEAAIAARIAQDVRAFGSLRTDHLALVGSGFDAPDFSAVGPQRAMPSGGLVAMGNVHAFAGDLRAGFAGLLLAQLAFLRRAHGRYRALVVVGDVYGLMLARLARTPIVFVGTAKSVHVAPYGLLERRMLRAARAIFVRDEVTAAFLRARGVPARAPGNVIVDLLTTESRVAWGAAAERIAILPGSRARAYDDAEKLAAVARIVARMRGDVGVVLSIAPGLDPKRFAAALSGEPPIAAWQGELGALLAEATLAFGQAGTANEAAAACGVPVVALEFDDERKSTWYRMRQARLLGDALAVVPGDPERAAQAIAALLSDRARRDHMAATGRARMGGAGGARAIAQTIADVAA